MSLARVSSVPTGQTGLGFLKTVPFLRLRITSDVEVIRLSEVNDAYPKVRAGKVRYRYVIDVAGSEV